MNHTTGYRVWLGGDTYWHRTKAAAISRAARAKNWCHDPQVTDLATGERVPIRAYVGTKGWEAY